MVDNIERQDHREGPGSLNLCHDIAVCQKTMMRPMYSTISTARSPNRLMAGPQIRPVAHVDCSVDQQQNQHLHNREAKDFDQDKGGKDDEDLPPRPAQNVST